VDRRAFFEALYGAALPKGAAIYVLAVADENDLSSNRGAQAPYTRPMWFDSIDKLAEHQFPDDANVYFGVGLRRPGHKTKPLLWTALHADIDDTLQLPTDFPLPTVTVRSGGPGRLHLYWLLTRPFLEDEGEEVRRYLQVFVAQLGADPAAAEPVRIMRVPDTWNVKREVPSKCEVVEIHPERRYDLEAFGVPPEKLEIERATADEPIGETPLAYADARFPPDQEYLRTGAFGGLKMIPPEKLETWGGPTHHTHSNLIFRVAMALCLGGHTKEEAHYFIWRECRDGLIRLDQELKRPAVKVWRPIHRAFAWVAAQQEKDRVHTGRGGEVVVHKGRYHRVDPTQPDRRGVAFTNFVMTPLALLNQPGTEGGGYEVVIENDMADRVRMVLPSLALLSRVHWGQYVPPQFVFYGNNADLDRLHLEINRPELPRKQPVEVLGWHKNTQTDYWEYVLGSKHAYTRDKVVDNAPVWYSGGTKWNPPDLGREKWLKEVREVIPLLLQLHDRTVTWALLGWVMTTFIAPQLRAARNGEWSGLWVWGGTGGGKSLTVETFLRLTDTPHIETFSNSTLVGVKRALAGSNTLPVFVDDPRKQLKKQEEIDSLLSILRAVHNAADDILADMGRRGITSVARRKLQAPAIVASEQAIENDDAMEERYFYVPVRLEWKTSKTRDLLTALKHRKVPLGNLALGFYRAFWDLDVAALWNRMFFLTGFLAEKGATTRRQSAVAQILVGLAMAQELVPGLDMGASEFEIAERLWARAEQEIGRDLSLPATEVFLRLVNQIDNLIATKKLVEGDGWRWVGSSLFVVLNRLTHELAQLRETGGLALTPSVVRGALRAHEGRYVRFVREKFPGEGNLKQCVEFDLRRLEADLGITGGAWKQTL